MNTSFLRKLPGCSPKPSPRRQDFPRAVEQLSCALREAGVYPERFPELRDSGRDVPGPVLPQLSSGL